jgi:hypothetical protein
MDDGWQVVSLICWLIFHVSLHSGLWFWWVIFNVVYTANNGFCAKLAELHNNFPPAGFTVKFVTMHCIANQAYFIILKVWLDQLVTAMLCLVLISGHLCLFRLTAVFQTTVVISQSVLSSGQSLPSLHGSGYVVKHGLVVHIRISWVLLKPPLQHRRSAKKLSCSEGYSSCSLGVSIMKL